jgi:Nitrate and nitrite sensing
MRRDQREVLKKCMLASNLIGVTHVTNKVDHGSAWAEVGHVSARHRVHGRWNGRTPTGVSALAAGAGSQPPVVPTEPAAPRRADLIRQPRTIRGRMVRALVVPLVTMLGLLGYIAFGQVQTFGEAVAVSEAVRLNLGIHDLIHELQRERGLTNGLLGGDARFRVDVDNQRPRSDAAREALSELIADDSLPGAASTRTSVGLLIDLKALRDTVDSGTANRSAVFQFYTNVIDSLAGLDIGNDDTRDSVLRESLDAFQALGAAKEATAKERGFLAGVIAAGKFAGDEFEQYNEFRNTRAAARLIFARFATTDQRAVEEAAWNSDSGIQVRDFEETATAAADGRALELDPRRWWDSMTVIIDDLRRAQQSVGADAENRAADQKRRAGTELAVLAGLALLVGFAVAGEGMLLVSSARSITQPLARLALEADDVASRRLPAAVAKIQAAESADQGPPTQIMLPTHSAAEIRLVAEAFDRVQRVAHTLAVEQAVLRRNTTESLANLGHRNQNLLRRQLGFISQLEREEADPTALANLFELDHLATRMRRNAESLLVLVGDRSPRRWSTPLPVADVIRAAVAEVEDYRRVELRRIDDAYITGAVVSELAHMIAELIENGLAFSPPDLDVEIYGKWIGTHYLIAVLDEGVGMTDEDLVRANARLRGEISFLLGPARYLGHYVVGRLASELGVAVQLAHSSVAGVTARLVLPPSVVSASADQPSSPPAGVSAPTNGATPTGLPSRQSAPAVAMTRGVDPRPTSPPAPRMSAETTHAPTVGSDRTRNGLLKRTRRGVPRTDIPPRSTPSSDATAIDRQPADVRAMLSAFRAGMQRGETVPTTSDSSTASANNKAPSSATSSRERG